LIDFSCTGVLRYNSISQVPPDLSGMARPPLLSEVDLIALAWKNPYETKNKMDCMPRRSVDREYFLLGTQRHTSDGLGTRWIINNGTLDMPRLKNLATPLLFDLYDGNEQNVPKDVTYTVKGNELVDIVLQNTVALNGVCETHPFHMHGHKFWVHSYGVGMYDKSISDSTSAAHPVLRDSLILYASEYAYFTPNRTTSNYLKACGWTKLRMIADNPGLWMLHCHIGAHALMGMNILIKEDIKKLGMYSLPQH
jgi:FtsP/CotA-like multicopper oxidase with cupredoxin domain